MRRLLWGGLLPLLALAGLVQLVRAGNGLAPITQADLARTHIFAYREWQSTGVRVDVNSVLRIRAEGQWSYTPDELNGPEGHPRYRSPNTYPVPGVPGGILIGRIGDEGPPFVVGRQVVYSSQQQHGMLYLRINDDILSDNKGAVAVRITVEAQPDHE